ncbi:MAG: glycosyltransferase family 39 protein, partial [Candidatus Pacebacteria bacterium]|nr:glycosyltransferase family 39 protein [Candidatus Paceibacterota bacterium]
MTAVKKFLTLLLILAIGLAIRAMGLNWDQGTFLHPDERFLVMVVQELKLPDSLASYFSTDSPLQVRNTKHSFYVYGSFPVVLTKLIAHLSIEQESFKNITQLGRWLTIILETLNIFLIFKLTEFLIKRYQLPTETSLWSSLFYALLVLPIQLSHFFTVDPFAVFFALLSLVFITEINDRFNKLWLILAGISFGLALASKLSIIFIGPVLAVFMLSLLWKKDKKLFANLVYLSINGLIFTLSLYLSLRLFNPEYFAFGSWLNPTISPTFIKSLEMLQHWSSPTASFPPSMQWLNRTPILFSLKNILFFGLGVWSSLIVLIGIFFS